MQAELSIIKLFLNGEVWKKYGSYVEATDFPEDLQLLYRTLDSYQKINEGVDLHLLDLASMFMANSPKDKEYYEGVFNTLETYVPQEEPVHALLNSIKNKKILRDISIKSYEAAEGRGTLDNVLALLKSLEAPAETADDDFVTDDLESLIHDIYTAPGLRWRLESLNQHLGSLRKGDFGFIFARPETGKTTFLASEVSYMAEQCTGPVIWFNNEEGGKKVKARVYQAHAGVVLEELLNSATQFQESFIKNTHGNFKLKDKSGITKREVESICRTYNPSLIVFDQIDKIMGFDADREDLRLGAIYIWARELAKKYGPVIGVCQSDGSGEGVKWLTMSNVANAKTSKQAEADWILGIGAIPDHGYENIRFFHLSKNKLTGDPDTIKSDRHGKWQCLIKPEIARYQDFKS